MNQKVGISVAATADTSQVEQAINALGQKIAQANRVQYAPVTPKSIDDVKKLNAALGEVLKTQAGLRQRLKATGQEGTAFTDWDWQRMYPHAASRGVAMQGTFERVVGPGRFSAQQPLPPPGQQPGGAGGGGGGGSALPGMGMRVVQAGLNAAGPAGGVAAGALGTGMSAGFGAGLMGLVGGIAALGVGKLVGAIAEKIGEAEKLSVDYDTLKRNLGDVGVEFKSLESVLRGAAGQMSITFAEAGRLGAQFTKLSNISGDQFKTLGAEVESGVGLSRSFGLDPSQGVGVLGQMRGMGITTNTQESRRFALLLGETIGKSGAFAKAEEVFEAIGGYATSQTRNSMGAANVAGYAGMYSAMAGSGIPGMDPAGAAGLLNKINSVLASGGAKGEASQFFTGIVGQRMGLDSFQTQVLREGGAFATNSEAFGKGSAYARYMGEVGPEGDTTLLQGSLDELRRQHKDRRRLAEAAANHLGVGARQAMALLDLEPSRMGEMQAYAGDLRKMSESGIGNLSKALYGSAGDRSALKANFLGRTGADAISSEDEAKLRGAGNDKDLKAALATIAAKYDQERTQGTDIRDSKNALDNIKIDLASKLIPLTQTMRDGILHMAGLMGGGKKSRLEVLKEIEDIESDSRKKVENVRINNLVNPLTERQEYLENKHRTLDPASLRHAYRDKPEVLAKKLQERADVEAELVTVGEKIKALEDERAAVLKRENDLRRTNIKAIEDTQAREIDSKLPPEPPGNNESAAETARLARRGVAPAAAAAPSPSAEYDHLRTPGKSPAAAPAAPESKARVTSGFGMRVHPITGERKQHDGIDFGAKEGTPFSVTADGEVTRAEMTKGGYGNLIEVKHADGSVTRYAHNKSNDVKVGQKVKAGDVIGRVGSTGRSTGPHLHYEVRKDGSAIDPNIAFEAGTHRRPIGGTPVAEPAPPAEKGRAPVKAAAVPPKPEPEKEPVPAPAPPAEKGRAPVKAAAVPSARPMVDLPPKAAAPKKEGTPAGGLGESVSHRAGDNRMMAGGSTSHEVTVRVIDDKTDKPMTEPVKIPLKIGSASPFGTLSGGVTGQWW